MKLEVVPLFMYITE